MPGTLNGDVKQGTIKLTILALGGSPRSPRNLWPERGPAGNLAPWTRVSSGGVTSSAPAGEECDGVPAERGEQPGADDQTEYPKALVDHG
jgi:hypothetical protein